MQVNRRHAVLALLIIIPVAVDLSVPVYNRSVPALFGLPFFYWFQTLWLFASAGFYMAFARLKERQG